MTDPVDKSPHYVDHHVGRQIRELRRRLHVSQEKLAETLGLTFQQVQKYEKGSNRVSASKLFEVSTALGVDVDYFFRGLPKTGTSLTGVAEAGPEAFTYEAPLTLEGREVDNLLINMRRRHRRLIVDMARALAADSSPEPSEEDGTDEAEEQA